MKTYKIAPGKSLVAKSRVYGPGEVITEDCFGDNKTITELLKSGSILEASEKAAEKTEKEDGKKNLTTDKKSKEAAKTEGTEENTSGAKAE